MKKTFTILSAIIISLLLFTNCGGGKSDSEKLTIDTTKVETEVETPKSDSKASIKIMSEKFYIPVDVSKSEFILTINQNLNLELIKYSGAFEGKYVDGKVQFDDKNATTIDFILKGDNVILKNQNDVEVEFRIATDQELLYGTWYSDFENAFGFTFTKDGNWTESSIMGEKYFKGYYTFISDKRFSLTNSYDKTTKSLLINGPSSFTLTWTNFMGTSNLVHTRVKKARLDSLNQIFN